MSSLYVNGRTLESLGLMPERYTPFNFPGFRWLSQSPADRAGSLVVHPTPQIGPRKVEVAGHIFSSSAATMDATIRTILSWVGMPFLELQFAHDLTKVVYARLEQPDILVEDPQLDTQYATVKLSFIAHNPYAYDAETTVISIGQRRAPVPLGTAGVTGILRLMAGSAQTVTVRRSNGEISQQFSITSATTDPTTYVVADGLTALVSTVTSGSSTATPGIVPPTADWPIVVRPRDRDPDTGTESTIEVNNGMAEFLYRRAYQ